MNTSGDDTITIFYNGFIHIIKKEPYENTSDVYRRGWFIIKNNKGEDYKGLYSLSIMNINKNKGMEYL
jgi:hypothetical protein